MGLKSIKGVEIFASGKWNGDDYTASDLDEMVRAFSENSDKIKPHLKLGHSKDQSILQKDGLPAAGWIGRLYRQGEKLLADFIDIPEKIYNLIEKKAYRKVSSEIYWNIALNGKKYKRMLSAVALLGADMPAVTNLDDILSLYGLKDFELLKSYSDEGDEHETKIINYTLEDDMSKELLEAKEKELEAVKKDFSEKEAELKAAQEKAEKEANELKEYKEKVAKLEQEQVQKDLDHAVEGMLKDKIITPAMKPYVRELLGEEKKEYSFKKDEKEEKFSKAKLVEEILKLHSASDVNLDENSDDGEKLAEVDKTEKAIEKYMEDNKCDYTSAYKAVCAQNKE